MGLQQLGVVALLVLMVNSAPLQEQCEMKCANKYKDSETNVSACKNGCSLVSTFMFARLDSNEPPPVEECYHGCAESFEDKTSQEACGFGCDQQETLRGDGSIHVSVSSSDPIYKVVANQFSKIFSQWPFFRNELNEPSSNEPSMIAMVNEGDGDKSDSSDSGDSGDSGDDLFASMHRQMENDMRRLQRIAHHLFNMRLHHPDADGGASGMMFANRPSGHLANSFEGPNIGNEGADGSVIIRTHQVDANQQPHLLGYMGENPMPQEEPSWLSRLTSRARRLSMLSQWLVCAALLLCLIAMLSISIAILKQIRAQRYHNIHNAHVIIPSTFGGPLPAKKVPLDGSSPPQDTTMEYPLIHDSPPPAYDQLSIHKDNNIPS